MRMFLCFFIIILAVVRLSQAAPQAISVVSTSMNGGIGLHRPLGLGIGPGAGLGYGRMPGLHGGLPFIRPGYGGYGPGFHRGGYGGYHGGYAPGIGYGHGGW